MSNNTNLVRIGGWSGISMILLFAVAIFVLPGTVAELWLSILASLLIVPFLIGVYFILRDSGNEVLIPTAFSLIGVVFLIQAYLVNTEFQYRFSFLPCLAGVQRTFRVGFTLWGSLPS
jgi:hypothetical protein